MLPFALNHMTAPRTGWEDLLILARSLGCLGVEFRNDLDGPLFGGVDPARVRAGARAQGLRILALAELKRFDDWSETRAAEAEALIAVAKASGAEAISLIPRNDGWQGDAQDDAQGATLAALREILPLLKSAGLRAMVEPLGFRTCALRQKSVLAHCIEAAGAEGTVFMIHDTFHHALAGFGPIFPALTGCIHVSGVETPGNFDDMRDSDRILVGEHDRLRNVAQIRALRAAGCTAPISFEAFSPAVHGLEDPRPALQASMTFLRAAAEVQTAA
ncbi:TIM barrel protein [Pseudogemmobacter sonorensis]|uniref:TIM barrel protein n=1 Tax=Pseudogemmobacter sonorensis TaxID=2989681 RepID=UPI0036901AA5